MQDAQHIGSTIVKIATRLVENEARRLRKQDAARFEVQARTAPDIEYIEQALREAQVSESLANSVRAFIKRKTERLAQFRARPQASRAPQQTLFQMVRV